MTRDKLLTSHRMGSKGQAFHGVATKEEGAELPIPVLIGRKRDGRELTKEEIQVFVDGVTTNSMEESQIGAMLMAIVMRGMTLEETSRLTNSMMYSGAVLRWPEEWKGHVVDKHSTGGVGDKISLPLAPALAACGVKVPMISGRGLGHTGGTLDKLESIPGYDVYQSPQQMTKILQDVGCCIVGQTLDLVPADKKLYATRDVTATVSSVPLITASIISKKGAEGLDALLLDVKTGCGAMLQDEREARELARTMVNVGNSLGMKVSAMLTDMSRPIGKMVGNALEIIETIECLHGEGPRDTRELTEWEGGHLLYNVGKASSPEAGVQMIRQALNDGTALAKFCDMLKAQGVSQDIANKLCEKGVDLYSILPEAQQKTDIPAQSTGYIEDINALSCAFVSFALGAGRTKADEPVDHAVGLQLRVQQGDHISKGATWVTVHHNKDIPHEFIGKLHGALKISETTPQNGSSSLIKDFITE